jgi:hypothetical protein
MLQQQPKTLGRATADLILAFGLFGARSAPSTKKTAGKGAWPYVLTECFKLLKLRRDHDYQ